MLNRFLLFFLLAYLFFLFVVYKNPKLSADPSLSQSMLSIGGPALKEFGYEPLRSFLSSKETVLDKSSESVSYANFKSM